MSSNYLTADNGVSSGVTGITQSAGNDGTLQIRTTTSGGTATTAVTIDNTQKVTFANSIGFGSNAGITFNNSSALTNSTLNDYETGTWTPTATPTTGTLTSYTATGYYTKIGREVYAWFAVQIGTPGTASGFMKISNLPFTSQTTSSGYDPAVFLVREDNVTSVSYSGVVSSNSTNCFVASLTGGAILWTSTYGYVGIAIYNASF